MRRKSRLVWRALQKILVLGYQASKVGEASIHAIFAVADMDEYGILPLRSSIVCILAAALMEQKCVHGKTLKHTSIVVVSSV